MDLYHFEYDNKGLLNIVLAVLHVWKENPLIVDERRNSQCIKEIFDLIIDILRRHGCNNIADDLPLKFPGSGNIYFYIFEINRTCINKSIQNVNSTTRKF